MMKNFTCILFLQLLVFTCSAQGYKISVQSNSKPGVAYLTYHLGPNFNVTDSGAMSKTGAVVFKGDKKLPGGIYAIVLPGKSRSVDFFVDKEQLISIKIDTANTSNAVITGSAANDLFKPYQDYVSIKGAQLIKEKEAFSNSKTKADSALHTANYNKYNKELNDYRENIIKTKPNSMMAALLNGMREPATPKKAAVTHQDSLDNYYYYRDHYWDGISFMDERVIRTPFFLPKLETYYRTVMPQTPDSLIKDIDYKLLLARNSPEMYKFLLNWFTDEYINPKYMGQDAVFVHLFNEYHSKGLTPWLNDAQNKTITRRAYMLMANLVGDKAANLEFLNTEDKITPLYEVPADYTVVLFWDPSCGHCKEELPRIDSVYRAKWKSENVKIYAVLSEDANKATWVDYIKQHHIEDWVNVYQTKEMADADNKNDKPGFRQLYDVTMTPTLYLLDKDKRIIGKKLTFLQLDELMDVKRKTKN